MLKKLLMYALCMTLGAVIGHYDDIWSYWSTDGLGFYEYLLLCEILNTEPVWVGATLSLCSFNTIAAD